MIIGNGLLGKAFLEETEGYYNTLVFASGVSSSRETNPNDFNRERELLTYSLDTHSDLKFIYFSTILADSINNDYYNHKLEMENLIKESSSDYIIFRLPQVVGVGGNSANLLNHLVTSISRCGTIETDPNIQRSIIDVVDVVRLVNGCKDIVNCEVINISDIEKISVVEMIDMIGEHLGVKPKTIRVKNKFDNWSIDNSEVIDDLIGHLDIDRVGYIKSLVKKYVK